jgi:hypothetical protein
VSLTRRALVQRAALLAALGAAGPYELLDRLVGAAAAAPAVLELPLEQYLFALPTVKDNGVEVIAPPLHRAVVTAKLVNGPVAADQSRLEAVLVGLERDGLVDYTPNGGVTVAWGIPYFAQLPASVVDQHLPVDAATSKAVGATVPALVDSPRFHSDPESVILEANDLAVIVASDRLATVNTILQRIFGGQAADLFAVTSIRRGFIDSSALGSARQSLTKQMAVAAGVAGASSIPDQAQLFLGFTSTQHTTLAPGNLPSFETLPGLTDQWPDGYFVGGTTLHLSHIKEDLTRWYASDYEKRLASAFSPVQPAERHEPLTVGSHIATEAEVRSQFARAGHIGHSSSIQPLARLREATTDNYGRRQKAGTAFSFRADFNTLDNPFSFSSDPAVDRLSTTPAAGLHFLIYTPTSTMFQLMRESMEGWYAKPGLGAAAIHGPFNRVLEATHRQNFLVPPRSHRSFPLIELVPAVAASATVDTAATSTFISPAPAELYS